MSEGLSGIGSDGTLQQLSAACVPAAETFDHTRKTQGFSVPRMPLEDVLTESLRPGQIAALKSRDRCLEARYRVHLGHEE